MTETLTCPFDPGCPGMSTAYPSGYRDPARRPGERDFDYWTRVFAARQDAVTEGMNAHMRSHPGFEALHFVWESA